MCNICHSAQYSYLEFVVHFSDVVKCYKTVALLNRNFSGSYYALQGSLKVPLKTKLV
jgi:hypothetical protein